MSSASVTGTAFQVAETDPLDPFGIDPVFEDPQGRFQAISQPVFGESSDGNSSQDPFTPKIQPRLDDVSIARLEAANELPLRGGAFLDVRDGPVTLSGEEQSISLAADQEARVFASEDGLQVQTDEKTVTFGPDSVVDIEGEGRANVEGSGEFLSFEPGDQLGLSQQDDETISIENLRSAQSITLDRGRASFQVEGQSVQFRAPTGAFVGFSPGQEGVVATAPEGQVRIENITAGEKLQIDADQQLFVEGTGTVDFAGGGEGVELDPPTRLEFDREPNGRLNINLPETTEDAEVGTADPGVEGEPPLRLDVLNNPQIQQLQYIGEQLLPEPDELPDLSEIVGEDEEPFPALDEEEEEFPAFSNDEENRFRISGSNTRNFSISAPDELSSGDGPSFEISVIDPTPVESEQVNTFS